MYQNEGRSFVNDSRGVDMFDQRVHAALAENSSSLSVGGMVVHQESLVMRDDVSENMEGERSMAEARNRRRFKICQGLDRVREN